MVPLKRHPLAAGVFAIVTHAACASPGGGGGASVDCRQFPSAPVCVGGATVPGGGADATVGAETSCVDGACVEGACGAGGLSLHGSFGVASGIAFDKVRVTSEHKMDVDAFEDGCLTAIRIELGKGAGCKLVVEAGEAVASTGGLRVTHIAFSADSQCPGFPDDREGLYDDAREMDLMLVVPDAMRVPEKNAPSACLVTNLELRLGGALRDDEGRVLAVGQSAIMISGELASIGSTTASCPCAPMCSGKDCGGDGCGFECGSCDANERCDRDAGACLCVPSCSGRACGDDGCGGSCGECEGTDHCESGQCAACEPDCSGKICGDDGCGGSCGGCPAGRACGGGQCLCAPKCDGKQCGDDGCGGLCGACDAGEECIASTCWCAPQCANKDCGDDGCGGDCGSCGFGASCSAAQRCETTGLCNGQCDALDAALCPSDCGGACGNGACDPSETHAACAEDCAAGCGDGQCKPGETLQNCASDCTICGDGVCGGLELSSCLADCIHF